MAGSMPQAGVQLIADGVAAYIADLQKAGGATDALGTSLQKSGGVGEVLTGALRQVGAMGVQALAAAGAAVGKFATDSIGVAGDFEQTLNVMGATSGATAEQLAAVSDKAIALGADLSLPATSANEAAQVMLELSKAGMTVQESMDAAKGSLQLAAAAQVDGATAAGIMAGALNAFELPATQAAHIADLLAGGANASAASMTDLGQGLNQAGFAFHAAGLNIDDLVTSLAQLTNVGLTGSDAGTALKNAIMRLMNPTEKAKDLMKALGINVYDAQGKMLPFPQLLQHLRERLAGMTDEQRNAALGTIFLSDGMKAMIPLLNMTDAEFQALKGNVAQAGSASQVAGAQMQGWNGAVAGLQSQLETLQLILGQQFLPLLTPIAQQVGALVGTFATFAQAVFGSDEAFNQLSPDLQQLVTIIGAIATGFQEGGVIGAIEQFSIALFGTAAPAQAAVAAGQLIAGVLIGEVVGAFNAVQSTVSAVLPYVQALVSAVLAQMTAFWQAHGAQVMTFVGQTWSTIQTIIATALPLIQGIIQGTLAVITQFIRDHGAQIQTILSAAWEAISAITTAALAIIQGALQAALAIFQGDWQGAWTAIQQMSVTVTEAIGSIIHAALETIAAAFGTSLEGIWAQWSSILGKLPGVAQTVMAQAIAAFRHAVDTAPGIGGDIIRGIVSGIERAAAGLARAAVAAVQGALSAARGAISAHSPSQVWADMVGQPMGEGVAVGIAQAQAAVDAAVAKLVTPIVSVAEGAASAALDAVAGALGTPARDTKSKGKDKSKGGGQSAVDAIAARLVTPTISPAGAAQAGAQTTVNNSRTFNMPVYTNQSPAVLQHSMAVAQALAV